MTTSTTNSICHCGWCSHPVKAAVGATTITSIVGLGYGAGLIFMQAWHNMHTAKLPAGDPPAGDPDDGYIAGGLLLAIGCVSSLPPLAYAATRIFFSCHPDSSKGERTLLIGD